MGSKNAFPHICEVIAAQKEVFNPIDLDDAP